MSARYFFVRIPVRSNSIEHKIRSYVQMKYSFNIELSIAFIIGTCYIKLLIKEKNK